MKKVLMISVLVVLLTAGIGFAKMDSSMTGTGMMHGTQEKDDQDQLQEDHPCHEGLDVTKHEMMGYGMGQGMTGYGYGPGYGMSGCGMVRRMHGYGMGHGMTGCGMEHSGKMDCGHGPGYGMAGCGMGRGMHGCGMGHGMTGCGMEHRGKMDCGHGPGYGMGHGVHVCGMGHGMMGCGTGHRGMMGCGHGPGYGMTGYGMGRGMHGCGFTGSNKQFLDETVEIRRELHNKRFEYFETIRDPEADPETVKILENDIVELRKKLYEKAVR